VSVLPGWPRFRSAAGLFLACWMLALAVVSVCAGFCSSCT